MVDRRVDFKLNDDPLSFFIYILEGAAYVVAGPVRGAGQGNHHGMY